MPKMFTYYLAFALVLIACAACGTDTEDIGLKERSAFESYLSKKSSYIDELPCDTLDGVWRVLENDREGRAGQPRAVKGTTAALLFEGYIFDASLDLNPALSERPTPFYTNVKDIIDDMGEKLGLNTAHWSADTLMVRPGNGDLFEGLDMGVEGAFKGDSLLVLITSERGYGKKQMGNVPENTPLVFRVHICDVK